MVVSNTLKTRIATRFFAVVALIALGCGSSNPTNQDGQVRCSSDVQCAAPTAVCDTSSATCVQCTSAESSACAGATPVCASDNTCERCTTHSQCASNVCLPDGSCSLGDDVAYVDSAGTDNTSCTKAMPCTKIASAVATSRPYIKIAGIVSEYVPLNNVTVTMLADPGAKLTDSTSPYYVLRLGGTSHVDVYDLELDGAVNATTSSALITVSVGGSSLSLHHVKVLGNGNPGIDIEDSQAKVDVEGSAIGSCDFVAVYGTGTLSIANTTIEQTTNKGNNGAGWGIWFSSGSLTVSRSTISANVGGGIQATSFNSMLTSVDISNSFIVRNGNDTGAVVGGVDLQGSMPTRFEFNTVVDNRVQAGSGNAGGVRCATGGFTAPNNIIARNYIGGNPTQTNSNTFGSCTYPTSSVISDVSGLMFASPDFTPYDYHLGSTSSAIDHATTPSTITVDFDGDVRPDGSAPDQGADER